MVSISITDLPVLIAFWLTFTRCLAVLFQIPLLDNASVPVPVKVLFSFLVTYAFFPHVKADMLKDIYSVGVDNFWYLTIIHTIIGLIIGYFVKALMLIFISTGTILSQQIGFAAVRFFDPTIGEQIGPIEKIIQWTLLILILSSGALLPMFKGLFISFHTISADTLGKFAASPQYFIDFFKSIFVTSILLASPIIFTNLMMNLVMGIIARAVPQMNVLMVSFVVNIGLGMFVFLTISDEFFHEAYKIYVEKLADWFQFVG